MAVAPSRYTVVRGVLLLLAILCFVLSAFSVSVGINLVDIGLALFAAAFIPWL